MIEEINPANRNYMLPVHIEAFDINDAWFQCVLAAVEKGHEYLVTRGSYAGQKRRELDFVTVNIKKPGNRPLNILMPEGSSLPVPNDMEYIEGYFAKYLMSDKKEQFEDYTYGERLVNAKSLEGTVITEIQRMREKLKDIKDDAEGNLLKEEIAKKHATGQVMNVDQINKVIEMYKTGGHGTNQATMEIGMPSDVLWGDPPCLRLIDTRIRYGKLHFFAYFRSWDLIGGFPSNLAGLQLLKEYMASEIEVEDGEMFAMSKGLHIYEQSFGYAKMRVGKKD
jgi:thymidylate synthase